MLTSQWALGLGYALGLLGPALWLGLGPAPRWSADRAGRLACLGLCAATGALGARLWPWVWARGWNDWSSLWALSGPLSSVGLMLGAGAGFALYWWRDARWRDALDLFVCLGLFALLCARLECHLRGCDFGAPRASLNSPWAVSYQPPALAGFFAAGQPLHPLPLYLSGWAALSLLMGSLLSLRQRPGVRACAVGALYLCGRLSLEVLFRHHLQRDAGWSASLLLGSFSLVGCIGVGLAWRRRPHNLPNSDPQER